MQGMNTPHLMTVLGHVVEHPYWFNAPSTPEERALAASLYLQDPMNRVWEVYRGGEFVGVITLWRIAPQVDALLHFVFFDHKLAGKRQLLLSFLGHCFEDLNFRRISMEIPETVGTLVSFVRRKLGFRFEGEARTLDHYLVKRVRERKEMPNPEEWIASHGSRREGAHWHDGEWRDVLCLRLTRDDFLQHQTDLAA